MIDLDELAQMLQDLGMDVEELNPEYLGAAYTDVDGEEVFVTATENRATVEVVKGGVDTSMIRTWDNLHARGVARNVGRIMSSIDRRHNHER